jgi:hypothetical protein
LISVISENFDASNIFGADIDDDPSSASYRRQVFPPAQEICPYCGAYLFAGELNRNGTSSLCCLNGKVKLAPLLPLPPALQELYDRRKFRQDLRAYNSAFTFASLGVKVVKNRRNGRGPGCFTVQGAVCHRIGDILPEGDKEPQYAQIYVLDPKAASDRRLDLFSGLDVDAVRTIESVLRDQNPYAYQFLRLSETIASLDSMSDDLAIALTLLPNTDRRVNNLPSAAEVAIVVPDGTIDAGRDVIVHSRGRGIHKISETSAFYEPLRYPLLFPRGELGWYPQMMHVNPPSVHFIIQ